MIVAIMTTALSGTVWAEEFTIGWGTASGDEGTYQNFTGISGNVANILSFTTAKNDGTTSPAYNSNNNDLRLYYNSSGNGGSITLTPATGVTITGFVMTTSTSPSVKYTVDGGTATSVSSTNNGTTYSVTGISATSSLMIQNVNTTNTQLRIKTIKITYTTSGSNIPTYTVTYNANGATSGTVPTDNTAYSSGATVTVLGNTGSLAKTDYTFDGWNTAADGSGTAYAAGATFTINANTTLYAQWKEQSGDAQWVLTSLSDLTPSDVFVIVGNNGSNYAMSNGNGTSSAPTAVSVTIEGGQITSTVANTIKWTISGNATDGYTFYPNGDTEKWLYCTNANNGVRVGTNESKTFKVDDGYLKHNGTSRYVGIYNSQDWRCYTSSGSNIANQTFAFYKKVTGGVIPPSITASNIEIAYDATSGSITYSVTNPVEGGAVTATSSENWLTIGAISNGTIALTCAANSETTARTATVTLTYTYNTNETVTKDVTVTQAAAPVIYTTIPALFAAATSTNTDVNITFGGWVVSAVHNNNAYLTDNQGNGLIIYASGHGFQAGDVLTGTVSCKLQLYRGSAELTELTTSTTGLSVAHNGTVTEQNITISELSGVNTGALLAYQGLTFNGTALVDGNSNTITPYATLFSGTFENGKTYNVTGIYLQYNTTKELLPRSADDIEEVVITTPSITVASTTIDVPAAGENDVIDVTYENITSVVAEVQFFEADGVSPATYDWITADINNDNDIEYIVDANTGAARTAYMKVYALDNESNDVYSGLITVTQAAYVPPFESTTWTLASSITSGKHYIIVNKESSKAMGAQNTNNRAAADVIINDNNNTVTVSSADVQEFVIYGPDAAGFYTIYDGTGYLYAASSSNNYLKREDTVDANGNACWEISFGQEGVASIKATQSSNRNVMQYNSGSTLFSCYGSASQSPVYLYEKDGEATPTESKTLNGFGYATYCSKNALDFTGNSDVTAWVITAANSTTGVITFSQIEGKVPAGTGMLLKGTPNGSATMTSSTGATALTNNLLIGTTAKKTVSAGEYYGLSGNTFVPVNAGDVPAGKALLPASALSSNVKAFTFVFEDDATGIEETLSNSPLKGENIYNLAGQMVNGKSVNGKLPKGIYIVNGKKVMVK